MSYIAVDLKVIEVHAPALARAMGVDLPSVIGSLSLLWHRCWSAKTDTITSLEVRGFFSHPEAVPMLEAFGFLEKQDSTWRVKGADRYLRLRETRAKAGRARASKAARSAGSFTSKSPAHAGELTSTPPAHAGQSTSTAPALTPSTEHRAPKKESAPTPSTPRETDILVDDFKAVTGAAYMWQGAKDGAALSRLKGIASLDEIRSRWRAGLKAPADAWASCRTVAQLAAKWNDLAPLATQPDTSIPKLRHL